MFSLRQVAFIKKVNAFLPQPERKNGAAVICKHCGYINKNEYSFCTNCGYPLQNKSADAFNTRMKQQDMLLFKAKTAVTAARLVLYMMASFLSMGVFFIFAESNRKYTIV